MLVPELDGRESLVDHRDVLLLGARTAQQCLRAGLLDELESQLIAVLRYRVQA